MLLTYLPRCTANVFILTIFEQHLASVESRLVVMKRLLDDLETVKLSWTPVGEIPATSLQSSVNEARVSSTQHMQMLYFRNSVAFQ